MPQNERRGAASCFSRICQHYLPRQCPPGSGLLLTQIKFLDMDKYNTVTTNSCTRCVTPFSSKNAVTLEVSRKYYTLLTVITLMLQVLRAFFCIDMAGKTWQERHGRKNGDSLPCLCFEKQLWQIIFPFYSLHYNFYLGETSGFQNFTFYLFSTSFTTFLNIS